jgi:hypothetical protein
MGEIIAGHASVEAAKALGLNSDPQLARARRYRSALMRFC